MHLFKTGLVASLLLISQYTFAQTPAQEQAAKLLDSTGMEQALHQSMEQMLDVQIQNQPSLAPFKDVMMEFLGKYMSYENIKPDLVNLYADAFTASELKELNAFYQTDLGKKSIEKMPYLMAKGSELGMQRVQANMGELQAMIQAKAQSLEAEQAQPQN